jgi:hypothetical protein
VKNALGFNLRVHRGSELRVNFATHF